MNETDFKRWMKELQDESTLTVKRRNEILSIFNDRVFRIWKEICIHAGVSLDWYAFSNDEKAYSNDGDGSDGGRFDPNMYAEHIDIIGEWSGGNLYRFDNGFPTSFLYSPDYEDEVLEALEEDEKAEKEKKEKAKASAKKHRTKKAVLNKLSKLPLAKLQEILENEL